MVRRTDRADELAGRVLAVHARHRLDVRLGGIGASLVVAVDADPVHLAAAADLVLADDGMLFSAWQAITQALQPTQAERSIAMPQA